MFAHIVLPYFFILVPHFALAAVHAGSLSAQLQEKLIDAVDFVADEARDAGRELIETIDGKAILVGQNEIAKHLSVTKQRVWQFINHPGFQHGLNRLNKARIEYGEAPIVISSDELRSPVVRGSKGRQKFPLLEPILSAAVAAADETSLRLVTTNRIASMAAEVGNRISVDHIYRASRRKRFQTELRKVNRLRISQGKPPIQILHTGKKKGEILEEIERLNQISNRLVFSTEEVAARLPNVEVGKLNWMISRTTAFREIEEEWNRARFNENRPPVFLIRGRVEDLKVLDAMWKTRFFDLSQIKQRKILAKIAGMETGKLRRTIRGRSFGRARADFQLFIEFMTRLGVLR